MPGFTLDTAAPKPRVVTNGQHRLVRSNNSVFGERPHTSMVFSDAEWAAIREAVHLEDLNRDRGLLDCDHGAENGTIANDQFVTVMVPSWGSLKPLKRCKTCGVNLW